MTVEFQKFTPFFILQILKLTAKNDTCKAKNYYRQLQET